MLDRRGLLVVLALAATLWAFFRPRSVACPQCRGFGAPPVADSTGTPKYARVCGTCRASATPDLPLFPGPAMDPTLAEGL